MTMLDNFPAFVKALPEIDLPIDGARGWLMQSGDQQVVFAEFDREAEVPEHTHAEQWEFPIAGHVTLRCGGEEKVYRPGDNFYVPADVPHSATVSDGYRAFMFFNSPDRYRPKE